MTRVVDLGSARHCGGRQAVRQNEGEVALAVGILGLMTVRPEAFGSLAIMGAAVVVGLGATLRRPRRESASADYRGAA